MHGIHDILGECIEHFEINYCIYLPRGPRLPHPAQCNALHLYVKCPPVNFLLPALVNGGISSSGIFLWS